MKRPLSEKSESSFTKKFKIEKSFSYYLPINSGLTFSKVLGYRVIEGEEPKQCTLINDFESLSQAEEFVKKNNNNCNFRIIRAIVFQDGFYLEDNHGAILDTNKNIRYSYINRQRVSEWDLSLINYKPVFRLA